MAGRKSLGRKPRLRGWSVAAVAAVLLLGACSSDEEPYVERPVDQLYNEAMSALEAEEYGEAIKAFDEVERQHPYSQWATQAQVMSAYSYYMRNKYDDAILGLDRFIQLHPSNAKVPYAHYLKGLCYYEQISDIGRDQKMTQQAADTFKELVTRYPDSKYARDAKIKLDLTYDHMAGKHMTIGRYYLRRGDYLGAVNRFKLVVEKHQTTTHAPEALLRLVEIYMALGLVDEAKQSASVLGYNFPGSEWYMDAYEMIEGRRIRPREEPWYQFWGGGDSPPPGEPPGKDAKARDPWYKFW